MYKLHPTLATISRVGVSVRLDLHRANHIDQKT